MPVPLFEAIVLLRIVALSSFGPLRYIPVLQFTMTQFFIVQIISSFARSIPIAPDVIVKPDITTGTLLTLTVTAFLCASVYPLVSIMVKFGPDPISETFLFIRIMSRGEIPDIIFGLNGGNR